MIDPQELRNDIENIAQKLKIKGYDLPVSDFKELEAQRKRLQVEAEDLQAQRNAKSKEIGKIKAQGGDVESIKQEVAGFADRLKAAQAELEETQDKLFAITDLMPNIPHQSVPHGASEEDNVELDLWGTPKSFDFEIKDHVDLGMDMGVLDFDTATKIAGPRFSLMSGALAKMHRALIQLMLDTHTEQHGYEEVYVPYLVNQASLVATGQFSKFSDHDFFATQAEDGYYLIPTAEVPVTNIVRDALLDPEELPKKWVAHTPCFRREAGSYGRDTRGIIRQHQFEKVELVQIVKPEDSYDCLEQLCGHAEAILKSLELPYRKVILCGGDLGFAAAKTYDLEVWLPGQQAYREISSCSNYEAFQSRRLKARYRQENKRTELVHTLNGSGLAVGRTLLAIMENFQEADGSISVPEILRPYMGGKTKIVSD